MSPMMTCPNCGHETEDFDGFGFIGPCESCGFCDHPAKHRDNGGPWICSMCGKESEERE